jgi:hypothetical protein
MKTADQRLDRIERVLATAIDIADKRMTRVERSLEILTQTQHHTDEVINKLSEEVRNLTAVVDAYFMHKDGPSKENE